MMRRRRRCHLFVLLLTLLAASKEFADAFSVGRYIDGFRFVVLGSTY